MFALSFKINFNYFYFFLKTELFIINEIILVNKDKVLGKSLI